MNQSSTTTRGMRVILSKVPLLLASITLVLLIADARPALAACSLSEGTDDVHKWTGGEQDVSSIQGVKADLESYNPDPVFQTTSFWVMLAEDETNPDRYAQVGWFKEETNSVEYVFLEFTDDSGEYYDYFYNTSTDNWTGVPTTDPSGSNAYEVRYSSGSPGTFYMKYSTGSEYSVDYQWTPGTLQVYGEVSNYLAPNKGDHAVGGFNNRIEANAIKKKVSGSWSDASPTYTSQGNASRDHLNTTSPGFRIWDVRCSG